jgi:hypothetical protein
VTSSGFLARLAPNESRNLHVNMEGREGNMKLITERDIPIVGLVAIVIILISCKCGIGFWMNGWKEIDKYVRHWRYDKKSTFAW